MSQLTDVELSGRGLRTITGDSYASIAEGIMKQYMNQYDKKRYSERLTTSKLRGIYALIMNIYVRVDGEDEYAERRPDIQYLKVRMAYEAGRDRAVKTFLETTHLMDYVDSIQSLEQFTLYCRYAEALVAYFKYFGGRDS